MEVRERAPVSLRRTDVGQRPHQALGLATGAVTKITDRCVACSGTGQTPKPEDAYSRITKANADRTDDDNENDIHAEDGVKWADVLALARFWRESN